MKWIVLFILSFTFSQVFAQLPYPQLFVPGVYLVKIKESRGRDQVFGWLKEKKYNVKKEINAINVLALQHENIIHRGAQAELEMSEHFEYVEPDYLARSSQFDSLIETSDPTQISWVPNDPLLNNEWHLPKLGAFEAWDTTRGQGTIVAVIDSGADATHPDLQGRLVPGWSFLLNSNDSSDVLGHGTAVAGTIAAQANNAIGVAGLAPEVQVMPLVALDQNNYATYSNIAQAIIYAADHGVRLVNVSIGGSSSSSTLQNAVDYAWSKNTLVFASAMNNGVDTPMYPAATNKVLAISATGRDDLLTSFSNFGNWIDFSAPGIDIYTTRNGGTYWWVWGTSFASPLSATVAALALNVRPDLSNQDLIDVLKNSSDDLGPAGFDPQYGYGRVHAAKAVTYALGLPQTPPPPPADTEAPMVSITSPSSGTVVSLKKNFTVSAFATDNVGVAKVEFFIDGVLKGADSSAPYSMNVSVRSLSRGTRKITARAWDAAGNNTLSAEVSVIK